MTTEPQKPRQYTFGYHMRLHGPATFSLVYDAKVKKNVGPLTVFARPNGLAHPRLGLSVPRRVGVAPRRNKIKRFIRESFRLSQHDWPAGYDVIVVVRPHEPATLAEYQKILFSAIRSLHQEWQRRQRRTPGAPGTELSEPSVSGNPPTGEPGSGGKES